MPDVVGEVGDQERGVEVVGVVRSPRLQPALLVRDGLHLLQRQPRPVLEVAVPLDVPRLRPGLRQKADAHY